MVEKVPGNQNRMNSNSRRRGSRGSNSTSRHLRPKNFNSAGANSMNWRGDVNKNNVNNESNNYGYNNHHLTSAFCMLIGLEVKIEKTDGSVYEGILEAVSNKNEFHLSHVTKEDKNENGDTQQEVVPEAVFLFCDIVYCKSNGVDLDFAKRDVLLTDSAISGSNGPVVERQLIMWQPEDDSTSHEALDGLDMNGESWNFEEMISAHEKIHGGESTFDSSMSNYMTPIEKRDDEEYREQERKAEQLAREIQGSSRHKELELVDSGVGEEEMFSSVSGPNMNNKLKSTVGGDEIFTSVTRAPNSNNNSSSNDGGPSYSRPHNRVRGGKPQSSVGPRLQRNNQYHNGPNINSSAHRNNAIPARVQNGNVSRNNAVHQQHVQQTDHHQNNQPPVENAFVNRPTLSYSAVTMKTQPIQNSKPNPAPKSSMPPQPLMQQQVSPPASQNVQNIVTNGMMANNTNPKLSQPPNTSMSPEALAAAKEQMLHNSRNYASTAQGGVVHQSQITATHGQHTTQINTSQNVAQPRTTQALDDTHQGASRSAHVIDTQVEKQRPPAVKEAEKKAMASVEGLSKYGKFHPSTGGEEEKKPNVNDLKDFSNKFQLSQSSDSSKGKSSRRTPQSATPEKPKVEEKEAVIEAVSKTLTDSLAKTSLTNVPNITRTAVSTKAAPSTTVSLTTTTATSTAKPVSKSSLNPTAKEFNFNPAAKEFTPGPAVNKHTLVKQISYTGDAPYQHPVVPQYYHHPVHTNQTVVTNPHHSEVMSQPQVVKQPVYRYPAAVYSIPAGEFGNHQGGGQVLQQTYMQNHNMSNHQPQFVFVNGYSSSVMGPQGSLIPVQSPQMVRYLQPHPGGTVQQPSNRFHHPEGVQNNFVIAASQHGGILQAQPIASNQHSFSTHASPSPHMQQQYVLANNNYQQQIASPINHPPGGNGPPYRPSTPIHSSVPAHHQPAPSYVMMGQHPNVAMQPNQGYVSGQHGILQNYPSGNGH